MQGLGDKGSLRFMPQSHRLTRFPTSMNNFFILPAKDHASVFGFDYYYGYVHRNKLGKVPPNRQTAPREQ